MSAKSAFETVRLAPGSSERRERRTRGPVPGPTAQREALADSRGQARPREGDVEAGRAGSRRRDRDHELALGAGFEPQDLVHRLGADEDGPDRSRSTV